MSLLSLAEADMPDMSLYLAASSVQLAGIDSKRDDFLDPPLIDRSCDEARLAN